MEKERGWMQDLNPHHEYMVCTYRSLILHNTPSVSVHLFLCVLWTVHIKSQTTDHEYECVCCLSCLPLTLVCQGRARGCGLQYYDQNRMYSTTPRTEPDLSYEKRMYNYIDWMSMSATMLYNVCPFRLISTSSFYYFSFLLPLRQYLVTSTQA